MEYKYHFGYRDVFNHPLNITDYIVCWSSDEIKSGEKVSDDYDCYGQITIIKDVPKEIAYKIDNIQSTYGEVYNNSTIVIVLRNLIELTFNANFTTPPPPQVPSSLHKRKRQ